MTRPPETVTRPDINDHHEVVVAQVAYTVADVAIMLGVERHTARRLIRSGQIRARHTGKAYRVPGSEIIRYLDGADEPMRHKDSA